MNSMWSADAKNRKSEVLGGKPTCDAWLWRPFDDAYVMSFPLALKSGDYAADSGANDKHGDTGWRMELDIVGGDDFGYVIC